MRRKRRKKKSDSEILDRSSTGRAPVSNEAGKKPLGDFYKEGPALRLTPTSSQPLPDTARNFFESRMNADFSRVRVHTGSEADKAADTVNARAFTKGNDIVFADREYAPESSEGKRLLAHELTHVKQQARSPMAAKSVIQRQKKDWIIDAGNYYVLEDSAKKQANKLRKKYGDVEVFQRSDGNYQCRYKKTPPKKDAPKKKSGWIIDKGNYYVLRDNAIDRAEVLKKKYGDVEIFQREDKSYQCKYKKTKPKKGAAIAAKKLDLVKMKTGGYSKAGLNDAVYTVFGEISATVTKGLKTEANAVASTIFNRKTAIDESRKAADKAAKALKNAKPAKKTALDLYEDLAAHPSKYKKKYGDKYKKKLAAAKKAYQDEKKNVSALGQKAIDANSDKIAAESYIKKAHRNKKIITLSMIVELKAQYAGFPVGKKYYKNYSTLKPSAQVRQAKRWKISRDTVLKLAKDKSKLDNYVQFRSNRKGKRKKAAHETRIGGNDFWP